MTNLCPKLVHSLVHYGCFDAGGPLKSLISAVFKKGAFSSQRHHSSQVFLSESSKSSWPYYQEILMATPFKVQIPPLIDIEIRPFYIGAFNCRKVILLKSAIPAKYK